MHKCLRCGQMCETAIFCDLCQSSLLERSQLDERTLFSAHVPQVQATERSSLPSAQTLQDKLMVVPASITDEQQDLQVDDQELESALAGRLREGWRTQTPQTDLTSPPPVFPVKRPLHVRLAQVGRLRRIFTLLAVLAIVALIVDCVLISLIFTRHNDAEAVSQPMLTFSPDVVYPGQLAHLQLQHFSPLTRVLLRRNIDEPVRFDTAASLLQVNAQGNADAHVLVEDSWGTGSHYIEAEDVDDHYVASAAVQVIGSSPALPAHLQLNQQSINLGAGGQGANAIQPVTLKNTGSGRITWSAWSNQPWLMLTPTQGTFSESQRIVIAASRDRLHAGDYSGVVTFVANTGTSVSLHVTMTVSATRTDAHAMLVVTPPALSFVASDSGPDPQEQTLTINNPGTRTLYWTFDHSAPTISVDQQLPWVDTMSWLEVVPQSGMLKPGATTSLHLRVHSYNLLPGVYSGILTFTGGQNTLNNPQPVAVSLVVQPRCGISSSTGSLAFTTVARQPVSGQTLGLDMAPSCSGSVSWHASSLAKWLTLTPAAGRVSARTTSLSTVQVQSAALAPGTYNSFLVFLSERRTQTVAVQLTVLASGQSSSGQADSISAQKAATATSGDSSNTGSASGPALALSSASLAFRIIQGDTSPPGQSISVANSGSGLLYWQARVDAAGQSWLKMSPTSGTLFSGQAGAIIFTLNSGSLDPGTYHSSVIITATDGSGVQAASSPQILTVTLKVAQPCTLSITPTSLSYSSSLLSGEPSAQSLSLQSVGDCSYPILWKASVDASSQSWIHLSTTSGQDHGDGSVLWIRVSSNGTLLGSNRGQITFSAHDSFGSSLRDSSQTVNVTLFVLG